MRAAQCMLGPEYLANRGQQSQELAVHGLPPIIPGEAFENEEVSRRSYNFVIIRLQTKSI